MLKKLSFLIALCATFNVSSMNNTISLDDLLLGAPHDWEPYLEKYPLNKIFKTIKRNKNYASMTDSYGNNLMLSFINFDHKNYKNNCQV